jgi:hypothetical protein
VSRFFYTFAFQYKEEDYGKERWGTNPNDEAVFRLEG